MLHYLHNLLKGFAHNSYDIICDIETWLNEDIPSFLLTDGVKYNALHKDRLGKNGGSVTLQIKSMINILHKALHDVYSCLEIVVVDTVYYNTKHRLACVYRAPYWDEYYFKLLCTCITYICAVTYP